MVLRHVCVIAIRFVSESCMKCLEMISVELALLVSCVDFFMLLQSGAHLKILSFEAVGSQSLMTSEILFPVFRSSCRLC